MKKQLEIVSRPTEILTVLSVSPLDEDHVSLQTIVGLPRWKLYEARDLLSAVTVLQQHEIAVVLCERDLVWPLTWTDMLEHVNALPKVPSLIVTARLADEHLWSEVLNRNGWDVLTKPFVRSEVIRSVRSGWQRWRNQMDMRAVADKKVKAAS
jgi:DNA-binding response OmpR family regulator